MRTPKYVQSPRPVFPPKPILSPEIVYRFSQDMVRMWRTGWGGDQFETLTPDEFDEAKKIFLRFSFVVREAEDD